MSREIVFTDNGFLNNFERFQTLSTNCKRNFFTNASIYCKANSREVNEGLDELWDKLRNLALEAMDDESPDVRRTTGMFLGDLSRICRADVYVRSKYHILSRIEFLLKQGKSNQDDSSEINKSIIEDRSFNNVIKNISYHKRLDSWICCLEIIAVGTGELFCKEVDGVLLNLVEYCLEKKDMYLEQDCLKLIHSLLCSCKLHSYINMMLSIVTDQLTRNNLKEIEDKISSILLKGMSSNNSGVRYQSCKAIKDMYSSSMNLQLISKLLPAIWFNRYSKETSLQQLCQETWVEITKGQGKSIIENHFLTALKYCFGKLDENIPADRINSCHCLSEIIRKLDRNLVKPQINEIYAHLKSILTNEKIDWQTTEDACFLLTEMISKYPDQIESYSNELFQIMIGKVKSHPSSNVMDSSAMVLVKLVKHYGQERSHLQELLDGIKDHYQDFIASAEVLANQTIAQSSMTSSGSFNVLLIERKTMFQDTAHQITPIMNQRRPIKMHQIYGQFCLLLYLSSILPHEYSLELDHLVNETWSVLIEMEHLQLLDLAVLFLSRVPEFLESMPKIKRKQQLDQLLEILVRLAKHPHNLHEASISLALKLGRTFGKNVIRCKLVLLDEEFVKEFDEKSV